MIPKTRDDAAIALKVCAQAGEDRFDLTACAIACAIHENPDRDTYQALETLAQLTGAVQKRAPTSALAFGQLVFGDFGFRGCEGDYDAPQNADFIDILIHKQGLPVGLGHVWRHAARVVNAPLRGTDTPGHFIMRLETKSGPIFLDPFEGGAIVDEDGQSDIARRAGLKELSPRMLSPVSDRVMAVRLQTNLVTRAKARGDDEAWFRAAFRRATLAPQNYHIAVDFSQAAYAAGYIKTALEWSHIAASLPDAPQGETAHTLAQHTTMLHKTLN
jgi:regulator of sirC expression with transglutaminase-like and TPR domain